VDFTAVAEAGTAAGLELAGFATQAHFLIGCGIDRFLAESPNAFDLAPGAKQLLLPTAMGERFKVLALAKGLATPLCGFMVRDLREWL
jgi:SAM-dependent MidA family methyltransferase